MTRKKRDLILMAGALVLIVLLYLLVKGRSGGVNLQTYTSSFEHLVRIKLLAALVVFSIVAYITLFFIPVKLAKVNRMTYLKETLFCAFASLVYFGVNWFLKYLDKTFSLAYMLLIYLAASILFSLLLYYISRTVSERSARFRTELAASISGGILFGLTIEIIDRVKSLL